MNLSILSWNVRGFGKAEKRMQIKDIVNSGSMEVVVLLEKKIQINPSFLLAPSLFVHFGESDLPPFERNFWRNFGGVGH